MELNTDTYTQYPNKLFLVVYEDTDPLWDYTSKSQLMLQYRCDIAMNYKLFNLSSPFNFTLGIAKRAIS